MLKIPENICRICELNENDGDLIDITMPKYEPLVRKFLSCANVTVKTTIKDVLTIFFITKISLLISSFMSKTNFLNFFARLVQTH